MNEEREHGVMCYKVGVESITIAYLYTKQNYRRQGHGERWVKELIEKYPEKDFKLLCKPARGVEMKGVFAFWRMQGFRMVGGDEVKGYNMVKDAVQPKHKIEVDWSAKTVTGRVKEIEVGFDFEVDDVGNIVLKNPLYYWWFGTDEIEPPEELRELAERKSEEAIMEHEQYRFY